LLLTSWEYFLFLGQMVYPLCSDNLDWEDYLVLGCLLVLKLVLNYSFIFNF
jgi:hypothetical protein